MFYKSFEVNRTGIAFYDFDIMIKLLLFKEAVMPNYEYNRLLGFYVF